MSTIVPIDRICGICGTKVMLQALGSTNAFGSPDLDLRPPAMQRHTMSMWLEKCPKCGYVASDITKEPCFDKAYLTSEEYVTCDGIDFDSELAKTFYRKALTSLLTDNTKDAYENILYAAWCCDDRKDTENAVTCRRKMDELYDKMPECTKSDVNNIVRHIDILRRSELFDKAIALCEAVSTDNELIALIIKFQKEKCMEKDVATYTVADVRY